MAPASSLPATAHTRPSRTVTQLDVKLSKTSESSFGIRERLRIFWAFYPGVQGDDFQLQARGVEGVHVIDVHQLDRRDIDHELQMCKQEVRHGFHDPGRQLPDHRHVQPGDLDKEKSQRTRDYRVPHELVKNVFSSRRSLWALGRHGCTISRGSFGEAKVFKPSRKLYWMAAMADLIIDLTDSSIATVPGGEAFSIAANS